jgi:hypothetical protein
VEITEQSDELTVPQQQTLVEFFRNSPVVEAELDFERVLDYGRENLGKPGKPGDRRDVPRFPADRDEKRGTSRLSPGFPPTVSEG